MPHWSDEAHLGRQVRELGRESQPRFEESTLAGVKDQHTENHEKNEYILECIGRAAIGPSNIGVRRTGKGWGRRTSGG